MTSLVLVHGITESKQSWAPLIEPLSKDADGQPRTLLNVDLRGHGGATRTPPFDLVTMATDVIAELSAASIDPADAVIIGHSLGGTVVTAMASVMPFRGVINVDQPLKLADFQAGLQQLEPMLRGDTDTFVAAIGMVFDAMRGPLPDAEFERISTLRQPEQDVVLGVWDPVLTLTTEELDAMVDGMAAAITSPYLSLHGIDPGPGYDDWLHGLIPGAEVEIWADHGHYP
ncbi:MAG: alpha/beta fold hydrolase, partial [Acidimicrobiales bacterium]